MADRNYDLEDLNDVLTGAFMSTTNLDSEGDRANVVDGLFAIAQAINNLADAVRKEKDK